jgi:hypothetical protein
MYNFWNSWFDKKNLPILRVAFVVCFDDTVREWQEKFYTGHFITENTDEVCNSYYAHKLSNYGTVRLA